MEKKVNLIFYTHYIKLKENQSHHFHIPSRFSFASNAANIFIHSLNRFVWKKKTGYVFSSVRCPLCKYTL